MIYCKVEGCDSPHHAKGYCYRHYLQMHKYGVILHKGYGKCYTPKEMKICKANGCSNKHHAKGFCKVHYKQMHERGMIENDIL